jgi:large subunit ribosomal protein L25
MRTQLPQLFLSERPSGSKAALHELRRSGIVPASVYGGHEEAQNVQVEAKALNEYLSHHGTGIILNLKLDGKSTPAIIKHVDRKPTNDALLHAEFQRVVMKEELKTSVQIHFHGQEALADRDLVLETQLHLLEIHGRADRLPEAVEVDVSNLEAGQVIHAGDIPLPKGVELQKDANMPVASAVHPRRAVIEEEPVEEPGTTTAESAAAAEDAVSEIGESIEEAVDE